MAYERGQQSVEVELSRTQSWIEVADKDLYGRNGDLGVIREHRDERAEKRATTRMVRWAVGICGSGGVLTILHLLTEFFHWVK